MNTTGKIKLFTFFCIMTFAMIAVSCKTDPKDLIQPEPEDDLEEYYEFQGFDLSSYEIPAMIMLPDETANIGASTKPEVVHSDGNFYWDIIVGQNFQMHIEDYGDRQDLVKRHKKSLEQKEMFEVNYLVDEPNLVVYERKLIVDGAENAPATVGFEHKSFHVYGQKVIKNITYELRSRDEGYEKMIIELMAKSIKSIKEKN